MMINPLQSDAQCHNLTNWQAERRAGEKISQAPKAIVRFSRLDILVGMRFGASGVKCPDLISSQLAISVTRDRDPLKAGAKPI
jgi:hypothetical protein